MNYDSRIRALEDRIHDLEKRTVPPRPDISGPLNFASTRDDGTKLVFITLNPDGSCIVNGKETRSPAEIGEAILRFQTMRGQKAGAKLLSMTPKGEA